MLSCLLFLGLSAPLAQAAEPDALVRGLMRIWETGDTEGLEEITHPDLVYDDVPNGNTIEGREGAAQYIRHVHSWASNVELEIVGVSSGPTTATAEWIMRGVQDRPIAGRVPVATGRSFEIRGATLIEVEDGRISRAADYIDVLGFVLQLGSRVELPGGVVLGGDEQ